jgi:hypothetical protein
MVPAHPLCWRSGERIDPAEAGTHTVGTSVEELQGDWHSGVLLSFLPAVESHCRAHVQGMHTADPVSRVWVQQVVTAAGRVCLRVCVHQGVCVCVCPECVCTRACVQVGYVGVCVQAECMQGSGTGMSCGKEGALELTSAWKMPLGHLHMAPLHSGDNNNLQNTIHWVLSQYL